MQHKRQTMPPLQIQTGSDMARVYTELQAAPPKTPVRVQFFCEQHQFSSSQNSATCFQCQRRCCHFEAQFKYMQSSEAFSAIQSSWQLTPTSDQATRAFFGCQSTDSLILPTSLLNEPLSNTPLVMVSLRTKRKRAEQTDDLTSQVKKMRINSSETH